MDVFRRSALSGLAPRRAARSRTALLIAAVSVYPRLASRASPAPAARLPPDIVAAARARGRSRDLQATAKELLEELGVSEPLSH